MSTICPKMRCFICNNFFDANQETTRYLRPSQLTSRLQDRKSLPKASKPNINVLEALEDITDGEVTQDVLKKYAAHYICHECLVTLRGAVNKKTEVERNIQELTERFSEISNKDRKSYYREHYGKDKDGRCWGCMYRFVHKDYHKNRSYRLHLGTPVFEGMTVSEAIHSLLEHQAETLLGLYERKTYVCRECVQLLRNVVKSQCAFDTLNISFNSMTHENGIYARLLRGEKVPYTLQLTEGSDCSDTETEGNDAGPSGRGPLSPEKTLAEAYHAKRDRGNKRPFHKTLGVLPMFHRKNTDKKRKVSDDSDSEFDDSAAEMNEDNLSGNEDSDISDIPTVNADKETDIKETDDEQALEDNTDAEVSDQQTLLIPTTTNLEDKGDIGVNERETEDSDTVRGSVENAADTRLKHMNKLKGKRRVQVKLNLMRKDGHLQRGEKREDNITSDEKKQTMCDDWVLYYYPKFSGRAEFARLIFEEAGVPYRECEESFAEIRRLIINGEMEGYPHFAPPMVKKGDLQVSQTPVICRFLGEELGLYPDSREDRLHAEQINQCCHDFIAEGRLSFHAIYPVGPYLSQKTETQPYIDRFIAERLPRWLKYFERTLAANNGGKGFLFGEKLCYCDLSLFHIVHATEAQFPEAYQAADYIPLLKAFKDRIAARPRISQYLKSDRWKGFCGDSMM